MSEQELRLYAIAIALQTGGAQTDAAALVEAAKAILAFLKGYDQDPARH